MDNYFSNKFFFKVKTHLVGSGLTAPEIVDILNKINIDILNTIDMDTSNIYEIIWSNKSVPVGISKLDRDSLLHIESGKYIIGTGNNKRILYSSQFLDFSLKELREYKLNKIL